MSLAWDLITNSPTGCTRCFQAANYHAIENACCVEYEIPQYRMQHTLSEQDAIDSLGSLSLADKSHSSVLAYGRHETPGTVRCP